MSKFIKLYVKICAFYCMYLRIKKVLSFLFMKLKQMKPASCPTPKYIYIYLAVESQTFPKKYLNTILDMQQHLRSSHPSS